MLLSGSGNACTVEMSTKSPAGEELHGGTVSLHTEPSIVLKAVTIPTVAKVTKQ